MKYAVVYTDCLIVEADSENEALERFHDKNSLIESKMFAYANPCFGDNDDLVDVCNEECWGAASKLDGGQVRWMINLDDDKSSISDKE